MRFKWANSISTFLRSRGDCAKAFVVASARAASRAFFLPAPRVRRRRPVHHNHRIIIVIETGLIHASCMRLVTTKDNQGISSPDTLQDP